VHVELKDTHSACRRCKQIIATPRCAAQEPLRRLPEHVGRADVTRVVTARAQMVVHADRRLSVVDALDSRATPKASGNSTQAVRKHQVI
jgi:hypothetical protein